MLGATIIPTGEWSGSKLYRIEWSIGQIRAIVAWIAHFVMSILYLSQELCRFWWFFVEQFGVWFDHLTRLELRNSQHETKFRCAGGNTICTISHSRFLSKWQHSSSSPLGMLKQYLVELKMRMQWIVFLSGLPKKHEKMHTSRRIQRWSFGGTSLHIDPCD